MNACWLGRRDLNPRSGSCRYEKLDYGDQNFSCTPFRTRAYVQSFQIAGWSSLVARQAHNLKAAGSNPAPATNLTLSG